MTTTTKTRLIKLFGKEPSSLDELAQCVIVSINNTLASEKIDNCVTGFAWAIQKANLAARGTSTVPGWYGRVWVRLLNEVDTFRPSALFDCTLTQTFSGGQGPYGAPWEVLYWNENQLPRDKCRIRHQCFSWKYEIYDHNWPLVKDWAEKRQLLLNIAHGNGLVQVTHDFLWVDPVEEQKDQLALNQPNNCFNIQMNMI